MSLLESIILAVIQGLAEFLPVSSSGHLELGKVVLGLSGEDGAGLGYTILLHFATALATLVVFRKTIWELLAGLFKFEWNEETKYCCCILVSMLPAGIVGVFFKDGIETLFNGNILPVGAMLIVTAGLLLFADASKNNTGDISFKSAFLIGVSQAVAILPGISRSGATISTSVLLKTDRKKAARFSFLMVLPVIFGEIILDTAKGDISDLFSAGMLNSAVGFAVAFAVGLASCRLMIKLVQKAQLKWFAFWCLAAGLFAIAYKLFF